MFTARNKGRLALGAVVVGAALALSGCASGDPLDSGSDDSVDNSGSGKTEDSSAIGSDDSGHGSDDSGSGSDSGSSGSSGSGSDDSVDD